MKMFAVAMLCLFTIPGHAQRLLESLETYQKDIQPKVNNSSTDPKIKVDPIVKTKSTGQCTEEVQTSLPLAYITSLIMEKDGKLEILHDPRTGKLSLKSPDMISNCSSMIEWRSRHQKQKIGWCS
jgi:hypothetical protein